MSPKISAITWVSKDRSKLLERSVGGFRDAMRREGYDLPFFVAGPDPKTAIDGLTVIDKLELCERLIRETKDMVPAETIQFALFGAPELMKLGIVDTGTNRNALLLSLVSTSFLCVDDDALCQFTRVEGTTDSNILFDSRLRALASVYFKSKGECDRVVVYPEEAALGDFLSSHERMLAWQGSGPSSGKVAVTMSGIHGDSGFGSPRQIFLSKINDSELYKDAIKNRLLLRYVPVSTATDNPRFQSVCAGFDNKMMLPPI